MGKKVRPESRYTLKGWYLSKILKEEEIIHVYVLAEEYFKQNKQLRGSRMKCTWHVWECKIAPFDQGKNSRGWRHVIEDQITQVLGSFYEEIGFSWE